MARADDRDACPGSCLRNFVTDDKRRAILGRHSEGESLRVIARGVGVSLAVVHGVVHGDDK